MLLGTRTGVEGGGLLLLCIALVVIIKTEGEKELLLKIFDEMTGESRRSIDYVPDPTFVVTAGDVKHRDLRREMICVSMNDCSLEMPAATLM